MGFKKQIKGLDEQQIKLFVKRSIVNGNKKLLLKSKSIKKSRYLNDIVQESSKELSLLIESFDYIDCPIEKLKYINKSLK
jgi:hypothetical protein